jgi:FtsH-binding integral membrane protein
MQGMQSVSAASIDARVNFIRKTYLTLTIAIFAFIGLEFAIFQIPGHEKLVALMLGGRWSWLIVLGLFMGVGWLANWWAQQAENPVLAYAGLALYVVAEAIIFLPILYIAANFSEPDVIPTAGLITMIVFAALTVTVFATKKDFSFLRTGLVVATFVAMGVIVASIIFGFSLGILFSGIMVLLASGYILYYTSNVLHHYHPSQHAAAALALFSAVALLFWYVLRIVMALRE